MGKVRRRLSLTGGSKDIPSSSNSKAVDDLLDTDLDIEPPDSCRSFASSITTPASQTGSFYQKVQNLHEEQVGVSALGYFDPHHQNGSVSDMTSEDDARSLNSWGGFSTSDIIKGKRGIGLNNNNNKSGGSAGDQSVMSSPVPSSSKKVTNKRKGKRRLKDFFRFSAQKNLPISEEPDGISTLLDRSVAGGGATATGDEPQGMEGSMALAGGGGSSGEVNNVAPFTGAAAAPSSEDQQSVQSRQSKQSRHSPSSRRSLNKPTQSDSTAASRTKPQQRRGSNDDDDDDGNSKKTGPPISNRSNKAPSSSRSNNGFSPRSTRSNNKHHHSPSSTKSNNKHSSPSREERKKKHHKHKKDKSSKNKSSSITKNTNNKTKRRASLTFRRLSIGAKTSGSQDQQDGGAASTTNRSTGRRQSNDTGGGGSSSNNRAEQPTTTTTKRRTSLGFRRLSIGAKTPEPVDENVVAVPPPPPPPPPPGTSPAISRSIGGGGRRHSNEGGGSKDDRRPGAVNRRSSMGSRRSSIGSIIMMAGRRNSMNNTTPEPVIPEDYHSVIHRERAARSMHLFERNFILDTLAQGIANDLAAGRPPTPCEFHGNIGKGKSLPIIHNTIMEERKGISRKNILSEHFTEFGMGLAVGGDKGQSLFMCTLFK